jgi:hypothetical protein
MLIETRTAGFKQVLYKCLQTVFSLIQCHVFDMVVHHAGRLFK